VIGPAQDGTGRQEYSAKGELEQACLAKAGWRFTQASDTPLLTDPLVHLFGEAGSPSSRFKQVLAGTFQPPPVCDLFAARLLQSLYRPTQVAECPARSLHEYTTSWRKARESTSSSPLGIHFGHYIAGTFNPDILVLNAMMADIPMNTGYSPARWRKGLNIMLEKSLGNFNVEKLQIILLFEADFNANNKWLGRAMMLNAEQYNLLAPEQYGSRKQKSAVAQCLNKLLFYDYIRFHKQPAALCSNDAKSCYDRIVLLIAALCLCRLGASTPSIASMISTLYQMEHHIRTSFSDSTKAGNQKKWGQPIAGIGQGNGASLQIWAAVSSPSSSYSNSKVFSQRSSGRSPYMHAN